VRAFHLFTLAGVPIAATPWFLLLLYMFASGSHSPLAIVAGICIGLLVHELGHALVALYLRHAPSVTLHGFGGMTERERTGRDVEEAAIIAMGPAAGLTFGLLVAGIWLGLPYLVDPERLPALYSAQGAHAVRMFVWPSITWNLLNLVPLWPLDGGQLFRLGAMRLLGARRADVITHVLALLILAGYLVWRGSDLNMYWVILPILIAWQNVQALRGEIGSGVVHVSEGPARELIGGAREALALGRDKEAARLAQQARASAHLSPPSLDQVWEILGLATARLGEHEEALSYLKRARPSAAVREATERALAALERDDELDEIRARWGTTGRGRAIGAVLGATLAFLVVALTIVFTTPVSWFFG
jgi:stage IV sporulation protein FB